MWGGSVRWGGSRALIRANQGETGRGARVYGATAPAVTGERWRGWPKSKLFGICRYHGLDFGEWDVGVSAGEIVPPICVPSHLCGFVALPRTHSQCDNRL